MHNQFRTQYPLSDELKAVRAGMLNAIDLLAQSIVRIELKGDAATDDEVQELSKLQQMYERTSQQLQERLAQSDRLESIKCEISRIRDKGELATPQEQERMAQLMSLLASEAALQLKRQKEAQACR